MLEAPIHQEEQLVSGVPYSRDSRTVAVYTRHKPDCPNKGNPYWRKCRCTKYLYIYANGNSRQISAKTRSWEKAEQQAQQIRKSFDPATQLQRERESRESPHNGAVETRNAADEFLKEIERLNREEATRKKYQLTLRRLSTWCATQNPPVFLLSQLNVPTLRRWVLSWTGAPTTRHNQHQRLIAFFYFCIEQGWIKENPAKKIKNVPPEQDETLPFTREQYEALIEATYCYDSRGKERNGETTNSRRVRAYLKLLRWSGLRAGDAACLTKSKLREDGSLFIYQSKVKGKASAPVYVLLPPDVANELRSVPPSSVTHPNHFFWSGRSKRKSEVSNWEKIFAKVLYKARELFPELFLREQRAAEAGASAYDARYICRRVSIGRNATGRGVAAPGTFECIDHSKALRSLGAPATATPRCQSARSMGQYGDVNKGTWRQNTAIKNGQFLACLSERLVI